MLKLSLTMADKIRMIDKIYFAAAKLLFSLPQFQSDRHP